MSKTTLTKDLEQSIVSWSPSKIGDIAINKMRPQHTALEVPVTCGTNSKGLVDAVRVSEYFGDLDVQPFCRLARWQVSGAGKDFRCPEGLKMRPEHSRICDVAQCRFQGQDRIGMPKILITCFEIKVSKSDFKSVHGHNFVGNLNYYVVPEELYTEIVDLAPDEVGILVYHHLKQYVGLRSKKKPVFHEMSDSDQKWMVLSVLKRIRDMDRTDYDRRLNESVSPGEEDLIW